MEVGSAGVVRLWSTVASMSLRSSVAPGPNPRPPEGFPVGKGRLVRLEEAFACDNLTDEGAQRVLAGGRFLYNGLDREGVGRA